MAANAASITARMDAVAPRMGRIIIAMIAGAASNIITMDIITMDIRRLNLLDIIQAMTMAARPRPAASRRRANADKAICPSASRCHRLVPGQVGQS